MRLASATWIAILMAANAASVSAAPAAPTGTTTTLVQRMPSPLPGRGPRVLGAPSPIAAAGLPILLAAAGYAAWRRRRRG